MYPVPQYLSLIHILQGKIGFDPEGSMFCVYSKDKNALAEFILRFKKACEDKPLSLIHI